MKKFALSFLMLSMVLIPSVAFAGKYNYLKFTSNSGETYTISTNNLEILISGENINFNNTNLVIPLSSLVSMEFDDFDDSPAEIDTVEFDGSGAITVYNLNGTPAGSFNSLSDALGSLNPGMYVIKDSNGNSLKVNVEK